MATKHEEQGGHWEIFRKRRGLQAMMRDANVAAVGLHDGIALA
jgi:hypothetical protein